ncbi:MAG: MSHA biogenesis protein MshM (Pilus type IV) [uncultured bacterium]|nr:MAG: MSHA biogenesis protein MshM (Pilus type IV) [uncultured bacterium]
MYQEFFQLEALPFSLTPNTNFFCQLKGHQEALNILKFCIRGGEGFIKIIGEVGSGKTLLCRKLLESLGKEYITAYIPNPDLSPIELRKAVARELGLDPNQLHDQHELLNALNQHLIHLHKIGNKIILIIDEAQALSDESLETVRLLTNLETENSKLIQVVLFGQPELDERLNKSHLRQLKQRITFSYSLPLLSRDDLDTYLYHRLAVAGYTQGTLFTKKARKILYHASQGVPRVINILSHKALLVAYGKGEKQIDHKSMRLAIKDSKIKYSKMRIFIFGISIILITTIFLLALLFYF